MPRVALKGSGGLLGVVGLASVLAGRVKAGGRRRRIILAKTG